MRALTADIGLKSRWRDMASKYGEPLTHAAWKGWPLRIGHFASSGKLENLVAAEDAVLVWFGGKTSVTLHEHREKKIERQRFVRHTGGIDFLPKHTQFEEVTWEGQASDCISVSFDAAATERLFGKETAFDPAGLRMAQADAHIVDLVQRLHEQAQTGQPWGSLYVESLSLTLATYVYGRYGGPILSALSEQSLPTRQSELLIAFVEDHLGDNLRLTDLAALVAYSPDHFARLFKHTFRLSPYQYILRRRVERAKLLLRSRVHSIAEVAVLCGFGSQAHLHAAFKARTGVTPGTYRRG
jgi:AraC family transcriptional regulator